MRDVLKGSGVLAVVLCVWVGAFLLTRGDAPEPVDALSSASDRSRAPAPTSPSPTPAPTPRAPSATPGAAAPVDEGLRGRAADVEERARESQSAPASVDLRVASFNVLGNSHTAGGGPRYRRFASGPARVPGLVRSLESNGVDVAGLQEFQPVQRVAFGRVASGWSAYPTSNAFGVGTTSVVWRTERFDLVDTRLTDMPFYDQVRPAPSVLLRDRATGVSTWVTSVHQPADTDAFPRQQANRQVATARQVALVRELTADGTSAVVTGDMNERSGYFCRFAGATGFTSPTGGSVDGGCRPPDGQTIHWILGGGPGLQWTSFTVDNGPTVRRTSDHALRVAGVRLTEPADGAPVG